MIFHIAICSPDGALRSRLEHQCMEFFARREDACIVEQLQSPEGYFLYMMLLLLYLYIGHYLLLYQNMDLNIQFDICHLLYYYTSLKNY